MKALYSARRSGLEVERDAFKARAAAFNSKKAEDQSDADFAEIKTERSAYIAKAKVFNADLAKVVKYWGETERGIAQGKAYARAASVRGEFHIELADGRKLYGAEALTVPMTGDVRLVTEKNSRVQLLLPDATVFTLGPGSDMVLDGFVFDPKTSASKMTAQIAKGAFRWVTGKVVPHTAPSTLSLPIGDLGIRGTDFQVRVEEHKAISVCLSEGVVDVTEKATGRTVTLRALQRVQFNAAGLLGPVEPLPKDSAKLE
jgi:ferric-dicitrate binding protein FerR (iron transport regulator)